MNDTYKKHPVGNVESDINKDDFRTKYFMGGHLNAAGYQYTAWMFMTYIDWIIRHNLKNFEQVAFIGTDYKY